MDSPVRQYLKQKDYRRHKLFRKINRRRKAERLLAIDAPMKELRRKLKRYDGGKDESTQKIQKRPVTTGGAGYIPSTPEHSNLILKDIAYRVMSQDSYQSRYISDIIKATLEAMSGQPYKPNYTGSFAWNPATKEEAQKDELSRDLNHLVIFGNTKKQFEPTQISGFDYSDFLRKNYGVTTLPTYKGHIENTSKVSIPTEYKPLVEYLADRPNMGYYSSGTEDDINDYNQIIEDGTEPFKAIDDTASYRKSFRRDKNGNPELAVQDLIDYKGNYGGKYGLIAGLQGDLLTNVINSPVILDQGIPVNYSDNPKDYQWGPGWYYTLQNLVDNNKILESTTDGYEYPLVLPNIVVKGKNLRKSNKYDGGKDSGIYIKPQNRGKFTALKKRTGKSASWFKAHGTPALKKMATFALNARKWKHK